MGDDTLEQQRCDAVEHQKIHEWACKTGNGEAARSVLEVDWFLAEKKYRKGIRSNAPNSSVSLTCREPS